MSEELHAAMYLGCETEIILKPNEKATLSFRKREEHAYAKLMIPSDIAGCIRVHSLALLVGDREPRERRSFLARSSPGRSFTEYSHVPWIDVGELSGDLELVVENASSATMTFECMVAVARRPGSKRIT